MELFCTFAACKNPAKYICECNLAQFCKIHIPEHKKLSTQPHSIEPLFYTPKPETRVALIKEIISNRAKLNENKTKFFESASCMIANIEDWIEKLIIDTELNFDKSLTEIKETKKICRFDESPILKLLTLESNEAIKNLRLIFQPELEFKQTKISEIIKKIEEEAEFFRKCRRSYDSFLIESNKIKENYIDLIILEAKNQIKTSKQIFEQSKEISSFDSKLDKNLNKEISSKGFKCGHPNLIYKPLCGNDHCAYCLRELYEQLIPRSLVRCEHELQISPTNYLELNKLINSAEKGADSAEFPKEGRDNPLSQIPFEMVRNPSIKLISWENGKKPAGNTCYQCEQIKSPGDFSITCPEHKTCNTCRIKDLNQCINCERGYSNHENEILGAIRDSI